MQRTIFFRTATVLSLFLAGCSDSTTAPQQPQEPEGPEPVAAVQVNPVTYSLAVGQTKRLDVTLLDRSGRPLNGRPVTWSSSSEDRVRVGQDGTVTALAPGSAEVTATSEGKSGKAVIDVGALVASLTIMGALDTLEAYDTRTLQASLKDAEGNELTGRAVTWTSSDPSVATIDPATGVLTGVNHGAVTITATSEGKSDSVSRVVVIRYRSISAGTTRAI